MASIEELKHLQIPLEDISSATNGFSEANHIGWGGFGHIYRGESEKHGNIAIKRLDVAQGLQGDREFKTEIALLSVYKHENIVSLHGFCDESGEKILVYKHERNGSLDKHLSGKDLTWIQRLQICLDAARGLKYLHFDVGFEHRIIHRDIKSSNILLDETWTAKISDFGLSKIGPANVERTFLISTACGTLGYIDPEYLHTAVLTKESDVFSFGVVLFEVLCGRPARIKNESRFLFSLARKHYERGTLAEIILSDLQNEINETSLSTFTSIAYHCLKKRRNERPTMDKVVEQLKKALDDQLAPNGSDFALQLGQPGSIISSSEWIPASSSTSRKWKYDVFISFRGDYTRRSFMDHLYSALVQQAIYAYRDDELLPCGESMSAAISKAIEESRISIILFSKNYANSSWCLDELVFIMKCMDARGQIVLPIFYDVEASEVRRQTEHLGDRFAYHESRDIIKVELWKKALIDASNLAGFDLKKTDGHESKFIKQIVDEVSYRLFSLMSSAETTSEASSADADLVGIETSMHALESVLAFGSGGVRMVGICGVSGSGKSTLASSCYKQNRHRFDGSCFVKDVVAESRMYGLKTLQERILSNVSKSEVLLKSIEQGTSMMKRRLRKNSVLIVLDDVDHIDHLKRLAGSHGWFGDGSRIIITTRNPDLMTAHNVITHNIRKLDLNEADVLFSRHAFGMGKRVKGYEEVSRNLVLKIGGHPSALVSLGLFLHGKDMSEWLNTLARLEGLSDDDIVEKFKASDDGVTRDIVSRFLKFKASDDGVTRDSFSRFLS